MAEVATTYQRSLEEYGRRQLSPAVHQDPDPARLSAVASALLASVTADEFAARIRTLSPERLSS